MDELPLPLVRALQAFEKWVVDFNVHINPPSCHSKAKYIITATNYSMRWEDIEPIKYCSTNTVA
jgi:hypothetical protein